MDSNSRGRLAGPFLIGLIVVAIVFAAFYFGMGNTGPSKPSARQPLAFGAAEQAYAPLIQVKNLNLSAYENMLHQKVIYLEGDISNKGARTILALELTIVFQDANGKTVLEDKRRVIDDETPNATPPLESGETIPMQIGFESLPDTWNHRFPELKITGLKLH